MELKSGPTVNKFTAIISIIVIGSFWGLLEMALGGFLHTVHFAQTGAVMGGIAISLMAGFLLITKQPLMIPLVGVIAASFKPFSALIYGQAVISPYVVNPAVAIVLEAVAFSTVAVVLAKSMHRHLYATAGAGFLAGAFGVVFYAVTASIFGMGKWPMLDLPTKIHTIYNTGVPIAVAGAVSMLIGSYAGKVSLPKLSNLWDLRPASYYIASTALIILCWLIPPVFHLGN